jgi:glutamate decarboxylase
VQEACCETADWISGEIKDMDHFAVVSESPGLPVVAFRVDSDCPFSVYDVSEALRARGWLVPAYPMPPNMQDMSVLRIVVRNGLSRDMARLLLNDIKAAVTRLEKRGPVPADPDEARAGFHH